MKSKILVFALLGLASGQLLSSGAASGGTGGASATGSGQGASGSAAFGVPSQSGNSSSSVNGNVNAGVNGNNVNGGNNANGNGTDSAIQGNTQIQRPGLVVTNPNSFRLTNTLDRTNVLISGTNHVGDSNIVAGNTNGNFNTNQVYNTNQVFVTNQVFSTNFVSVTNRTGFGSNDRAATEADRVIVIQVRNRVRQKDPGISTAWDTVGLAAQSGTVLVSGQVAKLADKQVLLAIVQNTPGVVAVLDQLVINPALVQDTSNTGTTGTTPRYLNPASDPSLGDSYRFTTATNRFGQRVITPPTRGGTLLATNLSPTGPTNAGSTNVILEGTVGTNLTTVPTGTNTTNP